MRKFPLTAFLLFLLPLLVFCGCSSLEDAHLQKASMMSAYLSGQTKSALSMADDLLEEPHWYNSSVVGSGDEVMWRLEAGTLSFLAGKNAESIAHFEALEQRTQEYDERAVVTARGAAAEAAALLVNPNTLPYKGLCRDRILFPFFKSLAYLGMGDEDGFRVELFRMREIQDRTVEEYDVQFKAEERSLEKAKRQNARASRSIRLKKIFSNPNNREFSSSLAKTEQAEVHSYSRFLNPLVIFMSGFGYARDGDYQNAVVDYERLYRTFPDSPLMRRCYASALRQAGRELPQELADTPEPDFPLGRDSVVVIFANGRSAAFRQVSLYIPVILPDYVSTCAIAWPACEFYDAPVNQLQISSGGRSFPTETIADMDGILAQEYKARLPAMITRIALGTAIREFSSYMAVKAASSANEWAGLAAAVGTTAYKMIFNTADTRTWEMLPKQFQIAQFPMPADRKVLLKAGGIRSASVEIPADAESVIIYVNAPDRKPEAFSCQIFPLRAN